MADCIGTCNLTGRRFVITETEQDLIRKLTDGNLYLGEPIPLPTLYPTEALRRVDCWGNLRWLAKRESALSKRPHLARFAAEEDYQTVPPEEFWTDDVDNLRFGRPYDFSRSFFEQFSDLMHRCWLPALNAPNCEGSDYINGAADCRNCYLCFSISDSQDCLYCMEQRAGHDNLYCLGTFRCRFCYNCINTTDCYEGQYLSDCSGCSSSFACIDCRGCSNCIGCVGLEHAEFCVFNEQKTRAEFESIKARYLSGSYRSREELLSACGRFFETSPHAVNRVVNSENCIGANITNCKNVLYSYQALGSEDCSYTTPTLTSRDAARAAPFRSELVYYGAYLDSRNCAFCYVPMGSESSFYCYQIYNHCSFCFGCVGLKRNSYCVLNKQYTKGEYLELVPRIVQQMKRRGEWGEFFTAGQSPHLYAESWAPDTLEPIQEELLRERGYRLGERTKSEPPSDAIRGSELPDAATDQVMNSYAGKVIVCERSGRPHKLQRQEVEFYRRFKIPLPRIDWRTTFDDLLQKRERVPDDAGCVK